jgi:hypothetical protein
MKRSNMLSKIASVIINYNEADCIINRDKAMDMAETVLQMQENAGMLPPVSEETTKQHNQSTIDAMFDSITYDCKWDLEE